MTAPDPDHFARDTLRLLGPAPDNWVPAHPGIDHNVLVVGGGQNGSAFAFALQRAGIGGVAVVDAAASAAQAGVWRHRARMQTLRTPKALVGPELSVTALGFQRWYESRQGAAAYAALERIPRTVWADYLDWFRTFLDLPVRYGTRLVHIEPGADSPVPHLRVHLEVGGRVHVETTRKLILANGIAGTSAPSVPAWLAEAVQVGLAAHTSAAIDFVALRGRRVAVIGAAASAFDVAAVALESGAAAVHLFSRRDTLAATPVAKPRGYPGVYDHYHALPDALRWQTALHYRRSGANPPADSVARVLGFPHFHLHLGAPWTAARLEEGKVATTIGGEAFAFDYVIAATGFTTDPADHPALRGIAPHIARWSDRYTPAADAHDAALAASPYLGSALEYQEKTPGAAPWLSLIHAYTPTGYVSTGLPLGDVPSMRREIPAVVQRISRDLLLADLPLHAQRMAADVAPDFGPELYASAVWRTPELQPA